MEQVLLICHNIIIIGGAIIIIGLVVVTFLLIMILLKVNSLINDIKERYNYAMGLFLKPFLAIKSLLNKFKKNG